MSRSRGCPPPFVMGHTNRGPHGFTSELPVTPSLIPTLQEGTPGSAPSHLPPPPILLGLGEPLPSFFCMADQNPPPLKEVGHADPTPTPASYPQIPTALLSAAPSWQLLSEQVGLALSIGT